MSIIVFSKNDKSIGVFNDKNTFKTKSFHYILDVLIKNGHFKTKKQCGMKIKDDLKLLYEDDEYTFQYKDIKFSKIVFNVNELEIVKLQNKAKNLFISYTIETLSKSLEMFDVSNFYNKNE